MENIKEENPIGILDEKTLPEINLNSKTDTKDTSITPNNILLYISAGFAAIGGFLFGYDIGVISGVLVMEDFNRQFFPVTSLVKGLIVSTLTFGCFFGAIISGYVSDKFGRKFSILLGSLLFILGAFLQTFSYNLTTLYIGRVIAGLAIGILSMVVPLYQAEISSPDIRGRLVSLQQWAITIGIAISFWVDYSCENLQGEMSWRLPLGLQTLPAFLLAFGTLFLPNSPRWLISKNRILEAKIILAKLRTNNANNTESEIVTTEYEQIQNVIQNEKLNSKTSYYDILINNKQLRRRVYLGIVIQMFQQLTGINSIMYYAPIIFQQAGLVGNKASLFAQGINGVVNMLATIPAILFVDKWGRRLTLMSGAILMAITMTIVGVLMAFFGTKTYNKELDETVLNIENKNISYTIIVMIYLFVGSFAFSWGPIAWIYPSEIFPLSIRSKAISLTTASNWLFNYIVGLLVPILLNEIVWGVYLIFAFFCFLMTISIFFFFPETKGKTLEQMDEVFNNRSNKSS